MKKKQKKRLNIFFLILVVLSMLGLGINWYLTYRLENKLKEVIAQRISDATNGFYDFSCDRLNVGFFSGELEVSGVVFVPNRATYDKLLSEQNLPDVYFEVTVGRLYLEGINLTWRFNYKELDFKLLDIADPVVHIYSAENSGMRRVKKPVSAEGLHAGKYYQMIAPYVNELNIENVKLENAIVSYFLNTEDSNATYELREINFYSSKFRLNKESAETGKLLFCDDFRFFTNKQQKLLDDDNFLLTVDEIYLNTQDSIIKISGVDLMPKIKDFSINETTDNTLKTSIDSLQFDGASFFRKDGLSYFEADAFKIISSKIFYYNQGKPDTLERKDTLNRNKEWSLYSIISPVLKSVAIKKIDIDRTEMDYWVRGKNNITDKYHMDSFDFGVVDFRVDNKSDDETRLLYSDMAFISAANIEGDIFSKNHKVSVARFDFDTQKDQIAIDDLSIAPINTKTGSDYIKGYFHRLNLQEIGYDGNLNVGRLTLLQPKLEYARVQDSIPSQNVSQAVKIKSKDLNIIESFIDFLKIDRISLVDGDVSLRDEKTDNVYVLNNFNFAVQKFVLSTDVQQNVLKGIKFDRIGFDFEGFDNLFVDKHYRLKIGKGYLDNNCLELSEVELIPQDIAFEKALINPIRLSSQLIAMHGDFTKLLSSDSIDMESLYIKDPDIEIANIARKVGGSSVEKNDVHLFADFIALAKLNIDNPKFKLSNRMTGSMADMSMQGLSIDSFSWNVERGLSVKDISFALPRVKYVTSGKLKNQNIGDEIAFLKQPIDIGRLSVSNPKVELSIDENKYVAEIEDLMMSGLSSSMCDTDSYLKVDSVCINRPLVNIDRGAGVKKGSRSLSKESVYSYVGKYAQRLDLRNVSIADADIYYTDKSLKDHDLLNDQKLTNTSLSFDRLVLNAATEDFEVSGIAFHTEDVKIPIDSGFYSLSVGEIYLSEKDSSLRINKIALKSPFSKEEFALRHPQHQDWFDVEVGNIAADRLNFQVGLKDKSLYADILSIDKVLLQNFKNQQIEVPHRIVPFIYEGLQNLPLAVTIDSVDINNFTVVYEELAKNGKTPGKIFFSGINGRISNFTNRENKKNDFITLRADGRFMGTADFDATWMIPVARSNDNFLLDAKVYNYDLTDLNQLITPLFPMAAVNNGYMDSLSLSISASSVDARVRMSLLYGDLGADILKEKNGVYSKHKFYSWLANVVIRNNNPRRVGGRPLTSDLYVERDPYHSIFNYLWQIMRPASIEAVGVSEKLQKLSQDNIFTRLRNRKKKDIVEE